MSVVRTAAGPRTILGIAFRDADNILRTVESGLIRTASGLKAFFGAMFVTLSPESVSGFKNTSGGALVTTGAATANPDGGMGPYTYLWEQVGASDWTINTPDGASTTFSIALDAGENAEASFICTVTDASGFEAVSPEIIATAVNLGGGLL